MTLQPGRNQLDAGFWQSEGVVTSRGQWRQYLVAAGEVSTAAWLPGFLPKHLAAENSQSKPPVSLLPGMNLSLFLKNLSDAQISGPIPLPRTHFLLHQFKSLLSLRLQGSFFCQRTDRGSFCCLLHKSPPSSLFSHNSQSWRFLRPKARVSQNVVPLCSKEGKA